MGAFGVAAAVCVAPHPHHCLFQYPRRVGQGGREPHGDRICLVFLLVFHPRSQPPANAPLFSSPLPHLLSNQSGKKRGSRILSEWMDGPQEILRLWCCGTTLPRHCFCLHLPVFLCRSLWSLPLTSTAHAFLKGGVVRPNGGYRKQVLKAVVHRGFSEESQSRRILIYFISL